MNIEPCYHEEPGEQAESCQIARSLFLRVILESEPECVYDLSLSVFPEFVLLVSERFTNELLKEKVQKAMSGSEVFATLFWKALHKLIEDDPVNKSIGDLLCVTLGPYGAIDFRELRSAFPNWRQLKRSRKAKKLCDQLAAWSTKWHLDADWCRDHAITTLRNCLLDEYLKWSFLDYMTPLTDIFAKAFDGASTDDSRSAGIVAVYRHSLELLRNHRYKRIGNAWENAAHDITSSVLWSRVGLSVKVHGNGGPPPFEFKWRKHAFARPGFNRLIEAKTRYKRRMELDFRLLLNEAERSALISLLKEEEASTSDINIKLNHGVLQRFRKQLNKHVNLSMKRTEAATTQLVKTKKRPKLLNHLRWTVEYQIHSGKSLSEIAKGELDLSTLSRAINDSLKLIGLNKRSDAQPGRKHGSKNTYDKLLKEIGHDSRSITSHL